MHRSQMHISSSASLTQMLIPGKMVVNLFLYGRNWLLIMLRIYSQLLIIRPKELSQKNRTKSEVVTMEAAILLEDRCQSRRKQTVLVSTNLRQTTHPIYWEAVSGVISVREQRLISEMLVPPATHANKIILEVQKVVSAKGRTHLSLDLQQLKMLCNNSSNQL